MDGGRLPKLIAFDLDYTLWDFWIDTHITEPLRQDSVTGAILDSARDFRGDPCPNAIEFYNDVPEILRSLNEAAVCVAAASRTQAPELARKALRLIKIPISPAGGSATNTSEVAEPRPAITFFDQLEIYPGSKIKHFKKIHKDTGIPYNEMLFFDDERRNTEVQTQLGVTFVLVEEGMNWETFRKGLREWRKRHPVEDGAASS
ncbi:hypothetical protein HYDPIDRAFT_114579 [Hydnomerulius pinastri MD-312]|uniref:Magnesium-dependent phosphatase-1 n=1 Tax=Hydnomerulius pinastri MD-312 TaxID=994086 RepID=A0A0C9WDG4_9AGAM|nr:hypothetical protein HYDPIDRAFT_114579 [Hydnomerulius pinastri MD-312]